MPANQSKVLLFADGRLRLTLAPVATLEFCQPERRNAMTLQMWEELPTVLQTVAESTEVRVLLVRGSGTNAFCSGADISEFEVMYATAESTENYLTSVRKAQYELRHLPQPTVALIHGDCVGSGCGLALACDLRFAAEDARFGIPPAKLGLAYSVEDTAQLVEKVGPSFAKDLLFSARLVDAKKALTAQLIDQISTTDQLEADTLSYAQNIAALSQNSLRTSKRIINAVSDTLIPEDRSLRELYAATFSGPDMQEGYRAFLQRRKPEF